MRARKQIVLRDNALTNWVKQQTSNAATNATNSVNNAFNNIKTPTITVSIDNKARKTVLTAVSILSFGLIASALIKSNK